MKWLQKFSSISKKAGVSLRLRIYYVRDFGAQTKDIIMPIVLASLLVFGMVGLYLYLGSEQTNNQQNNQVQNGSSGIEKLINPLPNYKWGRGLKGRHNGVDIGAPIGTPIQAAGDGIVEKIELDEKKNSCGIYLRIKHTGTLSAYRTTYCHCSRILVKKGDKVRAGQNIALVGNTGHSTGPHLHFVVRKDGFKSVAPRLHVLSYTYQNK